MTLVVLAATACDLQTGPADGTPRNRTVTAEMVTSEVMPFVTGGSFIMPPAAWVMTNPARRDSLLAASALELRRFDPAIRTALYESTYGGPIAWAELHPCGRHFYVRTPLAPLPASMALVHRQAFAPFWIGTLCNAESVPQMTVGVVDGESQLRIDSNGFESPWLNGAELEWWGVFPIADGGLPVSPEQAAVYTATRLGTRVAAVPEPWRWYPNPEPVPYPAFCMLWRVVLEEPRLFNQRGASRSSGEVYVGRYPACAEGEISFWLPSIQSPGVVVLTDTETGPGLIALPLVAPIYFDRVHADPGRPRSSR